MHSRNTKLTKKQLFGYGIAGIGDNACYGFLGAFLHFFLTTVAGVSTVAAGVITAIGGIWDAICSPFVGYISDKTTSKFGRRRPFILLGAMIIGVSMTLLFLTVNIPNPTLKTVYYAVMVILFWLGFSVFFIPYLALGAELTDDYNERTLLRSYTSTFNIFGGFLGQVIPTSLVALLVSIGLTLQGAWHLAGVFVALVTFLSIFVTWVSTKGEEIIPLQKEAVSVARDEDNIGEDALGENSLGEDGLEAADTSDVSENKNLKGMLKEYLEVARLKPLKFLVAGSLLYLIANTFIATGRMYYVTYYLGLSGGQISLVYIYTGVLGIIAIPLIRKISYKLGKKTTFISIVLIGAIAAVFFGMRQMDTVVELYIYLAFLWIGIDAYWQLFPSMIYDLCEVDELKNGQRREGIVVSILPISEALSAAIAVLMLSFLLDKAGFDGNAAMQSETVMNWMLYNFTFIPAIFLVLSTLMVLLYPLNKSRFDKLKENLDKKKRGEEYSTEGLEKVL